MLCFASFPNITRAQPARILDTDIVSFAVATDGTLYSWGYTGSNTLGSPRTGSNLVPARVESLTGVVGVSSTQFNALAVKSDGTVWAWGDGPQGTSRTPTQISALTQVSTIAAGWNHALAARTDSSVWAWGSNSHGQLGDGTTQDHTAPVQVTGLSNVRTVAAGALHSVAIKYDGAVWSWGGNDGGQLGSGTLRAQLAPLQVPGLANAIAVAAGYNTTLAVANDGYVWAAGRNWLGQLADGSFVQNPRFAPVQDANSGTFLDLAPGQTKNPLPAGMVPKFFMQSEKSGDEYFDARLGTLSNLSLKSRIRPPGGGFAADTASYQMFIAVVVPPGVRGLTPTGSPGAPVSSLTIFVKDAARTWSAWTDGPMSAYQSNVASSQFYTNTLGILADTNLTGMTGARFYVGYGASAEEMMSAQRYRLMYQVEAP